jgi:23S rRNA pseudouridine955/2504/2580 synthase
MSLLETVTVPPADSGLRLDRWLKARYPGLGQGAVQKFLRTGQIRVDGRRAKANLRLIEGMEVRVPPQARQAPKDAESKPKPKPREIDLTREEAEDLRRRVLCRDNEIIVLDKPAGLAVQGGTRTQKHLDGMLDALRYGSSERPRLVHRLDKDTSGVLVLARTRQAAQWLTAAFRGRETRKLYLAVTVGVPRPRRGKISLALAKGGGQGAERMGAGGEDAKGAVTLYDTLDSAGTRAALVALMPLTGRTHQLRAHMAAIETPILGDGKYGGRDAFLGGHGLEKRLHRHARALEVPRPSGPPLRVAAPLPPHLEAAIKAFGFTCPAVEDSFPRD